MQFINPKTDFAFKKIFGSEHSKEILISFLNALLDLHPPYNIIEVNIQDPYLPPKIKGMKDTYLDVKVKDQRGHNYLIEMQVLCVESIEKRILYNACKAFAGQIKQGEDYQLLTDVVAITITDFVMFDNQPATINKFKLRADDGEVYIDDLELVFAELPKFTKTEAELDSILDRWFYFMQHAKDLSAVPDSLKLEPAICQAFDIANRAGMTEEELDAQERREIYIQDQRGAIQRAVRLAEEAAREAVRVAVREAEEAARVVAEKEREEGVVEGIKIGEKKGMEIGEKKGLAEGITLVAKRLIAVGHDDALIADVTGLTIKDIQTLRQERDSNSH